MRAITLRDALFEAVLHHMIHDERLIAYGEECREWGGAFGVYRGLSDLLPYQRLFNSPISEAAIVATAVGHALEGGRSLIELMYGDFIGRAGDEIFNQMAKWQSMSGGTLQLPVVLRCSVGSKYGAQHSQDWTALVAHMPGLKVVYPATPYDAKGLLASALSSNDPVVFFESQRLYDTVETFEADGVPADYYRVPIGVPDIKREGRDVTILTIGPSLYPALAAAEQLQQAFDLSCEIIDARSLVPFDYAPVLKSLAKTGRLLIVSEASERGSFAMTLSANITRFGFSSLKAPPRVLGAPNWIVPGAEMEATYFPQTDDIIAVITNEMFPEKQANRPALRNWNDLDLARQGL
jgi:2-oxoisovalerate dehydrogenase E1 component